VAVHAIRNLTRIAFGRAAIRGSQLGFGRTSSTSTSQATPRNLFGFKDGTSNIRAEEPAAVHDHVWVGAGDGPAWLTGGSYLVARRIRMTIETWDRTILREQEAVIGRDKGEGAPLSGGAEFTEPDFAIIGRGDTPLIGTAAHVRLAHPTRNAGTRMLRRGYNFVDGNDTLGRLAGLFFISFQRSPQQFTDVQLNLARHDAERVHPPRRVGPLRRSPRSPRGRRRFLRRRPALRLSQRPRKRVNGPFASREGAIYALSREAGA
jgi:deferrochelatase/peroxidase EfeB